MSSLLRRSTLAPLMSIFVMQALITMGAYGIAVLAPEAAGDIGLAAESVGFLTASVYVSAMVTGLASSWLMHGVGPTRTFQLLVICVGVGSCCFIASHPLFAFLGAILIGAGTGPMNPAGSHVLVQTAPPTLRPLFFSLKQCGTPAGGIAAGALLPLVAATYDWRAAFAILPLTAIVLALLAPWGQMGGREPSQRPRAKLGAEVFSSISKASATQELLTVNLTGALLGACQLAVASYYVVYLVRHVGMSTIEAGQVFVAFHLTGIVTRVVLGLLAERYVRSQTLLTVLALIMAVAVGFATQFQPDSHWLFIYLVTAGLGISANGWVGLFFAELARLAPANETSTIAGGGQFIMYIGIVVGPLLFGTLLAISKSYQLCLMFFSALALVCVGLGIYGALLARSGQRRP